MAISSAMSIVERKNFQNLQEKETTEIGQRSLQDAETRIVFMNNGYKACRIKGLVHAVQGLVTSSAFKGESS